MSVLVEEFIASIMVANCGMCRADHLVKSGMAKGFTLDQLRSSAVDLGIIGEVVAGEIFISLPSHQAHLEPWARHFIDAKNEIQNRKDVNKTYGAPFDDDIPEMLQ